jgi:dihydroorotase
MDGFDLLILGFMLTAISADLDLSRTDAASWSRRRWSARWWTAWASACSPTGWAVCGHLNDATEADEVERGHAEGICVAAKLYPAGATTIAHLGATDFARIRRVLERMERIGMPLLVHGEATDPAVDIVDREASFVEGTLTALLRDHPGLKVVLEHVTTAEAADFRAGARPASGRDHHAAPPADHGTSLFQGGLRPHLYCLPAAKRERHRLALRRAVTGGRACFFLGTDTAPHLAGAKESDCGCAGRFVAPTALQCYAQVFDEEGALPRLEGFASLHETRFDGLPVNAGTLTLPRRAAEAPAEIAAGGDRVVVFRGGEGTPWSIDGVRP